MATQPHPGNVWEIFANAKNTNDGVFSAISLVIPSPDIMADAMFTDISDSLNQASEDAGLLSGYVDALKTMTQSAWNYQPEDGDYDSDQQRKIVNGLGQLQQITAILNSASSYLESATGNLNMAIKKLREANLL